ncbi:MAG: CPBP family intramembrane metalloprotease [Butyrivibrio sp.]|nr:CPBP family intramembrane metalloprotease [Butyrivibrio sp.]
MATGSVYSSNAGRIKWYDCIIWAAIGGGTAFVLTFIFNALGLTSAKSYMEIAEGMFGISSSVFVLFMLYCLVTPLVEELIFRYFIFNFIDRYTKSAVLSILLTSALFGIYHMNPVQGSYAFLMGIVITYSYYRYKKLAIPFAVHSAANAVALVVTCSGMLTIG